MWVHPWDVVDEGAEVVLRKLQDLGILAANLAVSYHSGSYLLPHNPKRRFFFADEGVVYFRPDQSNYSDTILKPRPSSEYDDVLSSFQKHAREFGIAVNAWTVCFHNSAFARERPELAVVNVFGDRNLNFICPNNINSRNYLRGLLTDLASNYELDTIKLESAAFPWGISHGDHHETFGTFIEPLASYVLSTCFCDSCVTSARDFGVDLNAIKSRLRRLVQISLSSSTEVMSGIPNEDQYRTLHNLTLDVAELHELLTYKSSVVDTIFREAKEAVRDADHTKKLSLATRSDWRTVEGINLGTIGRIVNQVDLAAYFPTSEQVYYDVRWAKQEIGDCRLEVAVRSSYPIGNSPILLSSQVSRALQAGAEGISFYNYGWTHEETFSVIKDIISKHA
jgi:hypothetical protein